MRRETGLDLKTIRRIVEGITRRLVSSRITVLTSPMIQEIVCSYLIEIGLKIARHLYTRLGMPFKDFEALFDTLKRFDPHARFYEVEKVIVLGSMKNKAFRQMAREYFGIIEISSSILKKEAKKILRYIPIFKEKKISSQTIRFLRC